MLVHLLIIIAYDIFSQVCAIVRTSLFCLIGPLMFKTIIIVADITCSCPEYHGGP